MQNKTLKNISLTYIEFCFCCFVFFLFRTIQKQYTFSLVKQMSIHSGCSVLRAHSAYSSMRPTVWCIHTYVDMCRSFDSGTT